MSEDEQRVRSHKFIKDTPFERLKDAFSLAVWGGTALATTIIAQFTGSPLITKTLSHFPLLSEVYVLGCAIGLVIFSNTSKMKKYEYALMPDESNFEQWTQEVYDDFGDCEPLYLRQIVSPTSERNTGLVFRDTIGIGADLLPVFSEDEYKGLVAHELTHLENNDFLTDYFFNAIKFFNKTALFAMCGFAAVVPILGVNVFTTALPVCAMIGAALVINKFAENAYSRAVECRADRTAVRYLGDEKAYKSMLEKIGSGPKWISSPLLKPIRAIWHTHPVGEAREANIHKAMRGFELP